MRPAIVTSVHFDGIGEMMDLLNSNETTSISVRDELVRRLKAGEGLIAVFKQDPPQALILASVLNPDLTGTPLGDKLTPLQFMKI